MWFETLDTKSLQLTADSNEVKHYENNKTREGGMEGGTDWVSSKGDRQLTFEMMLKSLRSREET